MDIKDGKGRGYTAEVDENNRLRAFATVEEEFKFISENFGEAFVWTNETYDYEAADTVLLVRNDLSSKKLHIWKILLHGDTETEVEVHVPTASFTIAGTAVVGQGLNRSLDKDATAYATAKCKETGNTQGDVVERRRIKADTDMEVDMAGALILGANQAVGVDYVTDGGEAHVSIWGYYK
jgi:hypothetical protein